MCGVTLCSNQPKFPTKLYDTISPPGRCGCYHKKVWIRSDVSTNKYVGAATEIGRNPVVSKHQLQPEYGEEQADAGRDYRICLARSNSRAQTGTGKYSFSLFSWPRVGLATLPGWSILLPIICDDHTCINTYINTYYNTIRVLRISHSCCLSVCALKINLNASKPSINRASTQSVKTGTLIGCKDKHSLGFNRYKR